MSGDTSEKDSVEQNGKLISNEEGVVVTDSTKRVERSMGLLKTISFIFGNIIGSGIFISVSSTFEIFAQNNMLVVVFVWLIGGLIAILGALCYAELGGRYPSTGGECVYYKNALLPMFSTLFAIMYVFVVKAITLAALSLTASKYLVNSFHMTNSSNNEMIVRIVAIVILLICLVINSITKKAVTSMSLVFLVLKLTACGFIIGPGIYSLCTGHVDDWKNVTSFYSPDTSKISVAFVNVLWSYEGWNALGSIAGDIKQPQKNMVASSIIGVFMVITAYILTVVSYTAVLGYDSVRSSETIALTFAKHVFGRYFWVVSVLITISAIGSSNGTLYALGGITMYSGSNNILPRFFAIVVKKTRIPVLSLSVIVLISIGFTFFEYQRLLQYCSFVTWFFYFLSFLSLWILKVKEKGENLFHIHYVFIFLMMSVCVYMVVMCFIESLLGCSIIAIFMILIIGIQSIPCHLMENKKCSIYIESFYSTLLKVFNLEFAQGTDYE